MLVIFKHLKYTNSFNFMATYEVGIVIMPIK